MKTNKTKLLSGWFICCVLISSCELFGQVRLPRLISDGMVLQRDANVKIWGWADPGESLTVTFMQEIYYVTADETGNWAITIPSLKAGGPYEMNIRGMNDILIKNILVGDVWVCSGQSNMELPMERVKPRYPDIIANAENTSIRQFYVPREYDFKAPRQDVASGNWQTATGQNILQFTATGYFFAGELYEKYHVPIGLINTALGGSPAEAWLSQDALKDFPEHYQTAMQFRDDPYRESIERNNQQADKDWYDELQKRDKGLVDGRMPWIQKDFNDSNWAAMQIPGYWANGDLGPVNGVVWFRKEVDIPAAVAGKSAKLLLGRIVDADTAYINGKQVGTTSYQYPPRRYEVPENLLQAGKNVIAVRVVNTNGRGGFVLDKPYTLTAGSLTIDLKGLWKYKLGATMQPKPGQVFIRWKPLGLYNGMIAPLLNYNIKGVIWYQGESNVGRAAEYEKLMRSLILDWRKQWNQGEFPFLFVQLPNFMQPKEQPSQSAWAELREAQLKTLSVPETAMAVTIDIGEWNDIHPLNKEDVGKRLALAAEKIAYGDDIVYSGPIYKSMQVQGNRVIVSFDYIGSGLVAKGDGGLHEFAIAGKDEKFVWAEAKIEGDHVIVWNDAIKEPIAVRYAWADNPEHANLYNKEGLPASPFRTDH